MTKILAALALLFSLSISARAAADPVSIETKWQTKTFSISTSGVTSITIDIGGFGSYGYAVVNATYTLNGVDGTTYGLKALVSTNTPNVIGFSYSALPVGAAANFQISQTMKTPAAWGQVFYSTASANFNSPFPAANIFTVPVISTSSVITVPSGVPFADVFTAQVSNPQLIFTGLTTSATLYFSMDYGVPRLQ